MPREKDVAGHQRASHIDGHGLNESYKVPMASNPHGGGTNFSHMAGPKLSFDSPWKSADSSLGEGHRPAGQIGPSKTVFPVNTQKAAGPPKPPGFAGASRAQSKQPGPARTFQPPKATMPGG
jgi:hypothetical protein